MTKYEKELYDIIARISTANAPIIFKGGLITNLVLQENGYEDTIRGTSDIDANWVGNIPDTIIIEEQLNECLKNAENDYIARVFREPGEKRSMGIEIVDARTNTRFVKMDMDIKTTHDTRTYHYGTMKINGVPPTDIIVDKISTISSDAVR